MTQELRDALNDWKNRNILGIQNKFIRIKKLPNNEYQIELSMRERINFEHATAEVSETSSLITAVQSAGNNKSTEELNSNGDIYKFNAIAANLEGLYWTKRENELSRLIQEVMPDGFLDM